ncbi:hypothetical protein BZA05DRAFT_401454, partial [Tricharina praecox]|uniref:uncharacterized protein n=1 Tax=Tricharina praecox TaxID=43433 RepID=UPI00221EFA90
MLLLLLLLCHERTTDRATLTHSFLPRSNPGSIAEAGSTRRIPPREIVGKSVRSEVGEGRREGGREGGRDTSLTHTHLRI